MHVDRLVRPHPEPPGRAVRDANRSWSATDVGRREREKVLQDHGFRAACLADQAKHDLNDLVLAVAAAPHCAKPPCRHPAQQERYVPIYLQRRSAAEIQSAVQELIADGFIESFGYGPGNMYRTLTVTAAGIELYAQSVRALGIVEDAPSSTRKTKRQTRSRGAGRARTN